MNDIWKIFIFFIEKIVVHTPDKLSGHRKQYISDSIDYQKKKEDCVTYTATQPSIKYDKTFLLPPP